MRSRAPFALGFRIVVLLLKTRFLNTEERYQRLYPLLAL